MIIPHLFQYAPVICVCVCVCVLSVNVEIHLIFKVVKMCCAEVVAGRDRLVSPFFHIIELLVTYSHRQNTYYTLVVSGGSGEEGCFDEYQK